MEERVVARCRVCGSADVQCVDWTFPNKGQIVISGEPWEASAANGETWCERCEDHTELIWYSSDLKLVQLAGACGYADVAAFLEHHAGDVVAPGICITGDCDVMAFQVADPRQCESCGWTTIIAGPQL